MLVGPFKAYIHQTVDCNTEDIHPSLLFVKAIR